MVSQDGRVSQDFRRQLEGYGLTTANILYRRPDHPWLLQTYVWQDYDLCPNFPVLNKFLNFWPGMLVPPTVAAGTCYRIGRYPGPAAQAASRTARAAAAITRSSWPDRSAPTFVAAWLSSRDATPAGARAGPALL